MTPAVARAAPISVCNTGQAAGCLGVLGGNLTDPNYTIIAGMIPGAAKTVIADGFPIPPWAANDGNSRWIGPFATDDDANGPAGSYTYRTTFSLAGLNPATASLAGSWGTDDAGINIFLNGNATGNTVVGFTALQGFSIGPGFFVAGTNTLDFVVTNGGGPTGLRVDDIRGSADPIGGQAVPEPASMLLLGTGMLLASRARRRSVK
jgi:hypothetical protein